jgi:HlyD family secretion protein
MKKALRLAVPVVLLAGVAAVVLTRGADDAAGGGLLASGTVEATEADIGFGVGGRIVGVSVEEGERVAAGQELARLDAEELQARLAAAEAQVGVAGAQLDELRSGPRVEEVAQARAAVAAVAEQLAEAQRMAVRARALYEAGAVSQQEQEQAATQVSVLDARQAQAAEQLRALELGTRRERVAAGTSQLQQAEAAAAQARAALAHATATSPWAGLVTERHREPGETVGAGVPVVTVLNPADRWVRVYIGEADIGRVVPGQRATIHADGLADPFDGRVSHVASEAEFTPRNVQTPEERSRLVYAVKVRILGDPALRLKPGMPVDVRLLADDPTDAPDADAADAADADARDVDVADAADADAAAARIAAQGSSVRAGRR